MKLHKIKISASQCVSFQLCGNLRLHAKEKCFVDAAKSKIKKIVKDISIPEKEAKCISECTESTKVSFGSLVKPFLIKSNLLKYLLNIKGTVQPIVQAINLDLSTLKKHFTGIVPPDLEYQSASFQFIIAEHNDNTS